VSWFRKKLPVVPDDGAHIEQEKLEAQIRLNEAVELSTRLSEAADTLSAHNTVNHYAHRLRKTYEAVLKGA
jgi:hypothetical protein